MLTTGEQGRTIRIQQIENMVLHRLVELLLTAVRAHEADTDHAFSSLADKQLWATTESARLQYAKIKDPRR